MSIYPPPSNNSLIFNPSSFTSGDAPITTVDGDSRYLKLTGSTATGLQVLNGGLSTNSIVNSGTTYVSNGGVATPSIAFSGDTNTGLYSVGSDILGISCGGINRGSFTAAGPYFGGAVTANRVEFSAAGTTTVPALSWSSDTNTGIYNPSAFTVGVVSGGNESARFTSSGATIKNVVTVDRLQVGTTGKICYWSDWGATTTIASVPAATANSISVSFGTTAPNSVIAINVSIINASNPDRVTFGCSNVTTSGFDIGYYNNYAFTVTNLKFAWTARV